MCPFAVPLAKNKQIILQGVGGEVEPKQHGSGRGCGKDQGLGEVEREHAVAAGGSLGGILLLRQQRWLLGRNPRSVDL